MKKSYHIIVDCANCANLMEAAARKVPGVNTVLVNFITQKIQVDFEEGSDQKAVMNAILKACQKVDSDCEIEF